MRFQELPTPCYVVDVAQLRRNLTVLRGVMDRTGCKILLAQKAFSCFAVYPLIGEYLSGTAASGLFEARLAHETLPQAENHVFSPAYRPAELAELTQICDHIIFNSFRQLALYKEQVLAAGKSVGLRLNPECSTQQQPIYDPCAPFSRLGITRVNFQPQQLAGVTGFHMHTLCEQDAQPLLQTVAALEEKFGDWLGQLEWLNLGGGHHITRPGYEIAALEACLTRLQHKYGVQVYLEPGEAIALNAGYLVSSVLETLHNGRDLAILDTSAACHMPDVLEMPYRPPLLGAGEAGDKPYLYRLGGPTCLAGDVIGDYSFDKPLEPGDRLVFADMAIYSMVKNNTFNGVPLPAIALQEEDGDCRIVREFNYSDFKNRLS